MKRLRTLFASLAILSGSLAAPLGAAEHLDSAANITASQALVKIPAATLDMLSTSMRLDMLEYLKHDSIYEVPNVLEGLSRFNPPVTDDYLQIQVTPVSRFSIRILPGKKEPVVATAYTVGDSLEAPDTQLQFFTTDMQEIKLDKVFRLLSTSDFLDLHGLSRRERNEIIELVPFPMVEYSFSPDGTDLKAQLTSGEFLGREVNERLRPYLRRVRTLRWDGHQYKLVKLEDKKE